MKLFINRSSGLKVGLNAWFWSQPDVGLGQYVRWLAAALVTAEPQLDLYLISPRPLFEEPSAGEGPSPRLKEIVAPTPFKDADSYLSRLWFEQVTFPRKCRELKLDLAHVPYYGLSLWPSLPSVVTVHDLIPLLLPFYRQQLGLRIYGRLIRLATPRARMIITVSEASRRDILRHIDLSPDRISVIYSAPGPAFQVVTDEGQLAAVRSKYSLPASYLLYVGGYDARKNVDILLQAYARTAPDFRKRFPLVLAGTLPPAHTALRPDPRRQIRRLNLEADVMTPGWIASADLPALYSGATLLVYPSRYEGFGLPVLEAMACGTAVLATTAASLPEIAGGAACLVEPDNAPALAAAMIALSTDPDLNRRAVRRGLIQAGCFTWEQTARQTLQAYRDAL